VAGRGGSAATAQEKEGNTVAVIWSSLSALRQEEGARGCTRHRRHPRFKPIIRGQPKRVLRTQPPRAPSHILSNPVNHTFLHTPGCSAPHTTAQWSPPIRIVHSHTPCETPGPALKSSCPTSSIRLNVAAPTQRHNRATPVKTMGGKALAHQLLSIQVLSCHPHVASAAHISQTCVRFASTNRSSQHVTITACSPLCTIARSITLKQTVPAIM
jgi:hypothetical protein